MTELIIASIATFGLSALMVDYDAPFDLFKKLRSFKWLPFRCVVCTATWIAIPIAILSGLNFVEYVSIIGVVIITERLT